MRLIVIALVAVGCWTLAALFAWAVVHVGARDDPPEWDEPEVQPPDPYTFGLSESTWNDGNATITYTHTSGGSRDWRN